ncbi:MAG TPA: methylated-DNA--[protein]-cysteine S-methyltransferase [Planctomycetaceae bacterium]|nr:methylated-DNA--[protein]-cysteine S-methyltransferase [Planctomycetaceae bacterium]
MGTTLLSLEAAVFETRLGFFGVALRERTILKIVIGQPSTASARQILSRSFEGSLDLSNSKEEPSETLAKLQTALTDYALGLRVDFSKFLLNLNPLTAYQKKVTEVVRSIPYGETLSYLQVAELSGSPKAARAVGNVMANNRFPIVVPCHRVLASGGKLGGFSAPGGTSFKQSLLDLENSER